MNFWDLHGPSKFLSDVEEGLRSNRACIAAFPARKPLGFANAFAEKIGRQGWFQVSLTWNAGEHPLAFLFRELAIEISPEESQSVALLLEQLGSIVVIVDEIPPQCWPAWKRLLLEYERELRGIGDGQVPLLLCVLSGVEQTAAKLNAPAVANYFWLGIVGELDTQVFIRSQLLDFDRSSTEQEVSSRIISKLSLWDVELASKLIPLSIADLTHPHGVLQEIAKESQWHPGDIRSWSRGTEETFEGRSAPHSLWLCTNGGDAELVFRVWSAQASIGLMLVEQRRRELAPKASRHLRFPIEVNGELARTVHDLEIGQLAHNLSVAHCSDRDLMRRVKLLKRVRNLLAHVEVVEPSLFFDTDLLG